MVTPAAAMSAPPQKNPLKGPGGGGLGVPARPGLRDERARVSGHRDGPFLVAGDPAGGLAARLPQCGPPPCAGPWRAGASAAGAHAADGEGGAGELGGEHGGGRRQKTEERRSGEGGRGHGRDVPERVRVHRAFSHAGRGDEHRGRCDKRLAGIHDAAPPASEGEAGRDEAHEKDEGDGQNEPSEEGGFGKPVHRGVLALGIGQRIYLGGGLLQSRGGILGKGVAAGTAQMLAGPGHGGLIGGGGFHELGGEAPGHGRPNSSAVK